MATKTLQPLDLNQRYSINEACDYLRVSRVQVYKLIGDGRLATIKEGRRRFVPGSAIAARSNELASDPE